MSITVSVNVFDVKDSEVTRNGSAPVFNSSYLTVKAHAKWVAKPVTSENPGQYTVSAYYSISVNYTGLPDEIKLKITNHETEGWYNRVGFKDGGANRFNHPEDYVWQVNKFTPNEEYEVSSTSAAHMDARDTWRDETKAGRITYIPFHIFIYRVQGDTTETIVDEAIHFHINGTFYGGKDLNRYHITYLKDNGKVYKVDQTTTGHDSIPYKIWPEYPESTVPDTASGSGKYEVNYSSAGKTKDYSYSWTQSVNIKWDCWKDEKGNKYNPNTIYQITSDTILTATYDINRGDKNFTYSTLNYFPTAQKFGYYDSTNWRYSDDYSGGGHSYSKGSPASMGDYVVTNETLYAEFQPKSYRIMYRTVDRNNVGGWTSDLDAGQPKTFGSSSVALINPELTRTGYKFDGWINEDAYKKLDNGNQTIYTPKKYSWYYGYKDKSGKKTTDDEEAHIHGVGDSVNSNKLLKSVKLGGDGVEASSTPEYDVPAQKSSNIKSFDDTYYKKLASISSPDGFTVPLNAIWSYNENLLKLRYYDEPRNDNDTNPFDDPVRETNFFYNIDSNGFELNSPYEIDTSKSKPESIKNYVFYGWINADDLTNEAVKWWTETHGMFINPRQLLKGLTDAGVTVKPGTIIMKASDIRKIGSTAEYGSWDTTKFYYGFWVGSSKFIKINKVWRRIAEVFVKKDNKWEPVDVMRIQIDDGVSPSTAKYPYTRNDYKWKMEEVVVKNYNSLNS